MPAGDRPAWFDEGQSCRSLAISNLVGRLAFVARTSIAPRCATGIRTKYGFVYGDAIPAGPQVSAVAPLRGPGDRQASTGVMAATRRSAQRYGGRQGRAGRKQGRG